MWIIEISRLRPDEWIRWKKYSLICQECQYKLAKYQKIPHRAGPFVIMLKLFFGFVTDKSSNIGYRIHDLCRENNCRVFLGRYFAQDL
jgi:hypothetical protein